MVGNKAEVNVTNKWVLGLSISCIGTLTGLLVALAMTWAREVNQDLKAIPILQTEFQHISKNLEELKRGQESLLQELRKGAGAP